MWHDYDGEWKMEIQTCKECGFILGTRPGLTDRDGVCSACTNNEKKKYINYSERQTWLTEYIKDNISSNKYDCLVAVSGGKDSTAILRLLFENHGVRKALLVRIGDNFTQTKTGRDNVQNMLKQFNTDLINYQINYEELSEHIRADFRKYLNPLKWLEQQIYIIPLELARALNIKLVFYGENAAFEYGSAETLEIFHEASDENLKVIYMGSIYPYSAEHWYQMAKEVGFKDLNVLNEWQRQGQIENYSQVDSLGYHMGIWTKFVKFGFQRVSDIACRLVRDKSLSIEQARELIKDQDYICDPASKRDFCRAIGITEVDFDRTVDQHANRNIVIKDINGRWRRRDLYSHNSN